MGLPVSITLFILIIYILVIFFLFLGLLLLKKPSGDSTAGKEKVTVVIPFRNEADHLPGLINDLVRQNYPEELFFVILVNDHSTDGSGLMAASLVEAYKRFSCLDLPWGRNGKKEAIALAVESSKTTWIIQTDADCRVGPEFIAAHISFLEEHPSDLVAGFVTTWTRRGGFLEAFQRLDMFGLTGTGAGSYPYGRPLMCSGANLLYSKGLYLDTRLFDPADKTPSGDDMFMLIGARKLNRRISFNPGKKVQVSTSPVRSPGALIRQRIRWGGKSARYRTGDIQILAVVVALASFGVLFSPVWIISEPACAGWLLPAMGVKLIVDFLMLAAVAGKTGQGRTLLWFFPVWMVYCLYMPVVIIGSLLLGTTWKGRAFR
ncbi:MAG: glycosyltransferase [Bacteroidota bacterium]